MVQYMGKLRPVERRLVKIAQKILEKEFDEEPLYCFTNSRGILDAKKEIIQHHVEDAKINLSENRLQEQEQIFSEMISLRGEILLDGDAIAKAARRLGTGLNSTQEVYLLHSLGHLATRKYRDVSIEYLKNKMNEGGVAKLEVGRLSLLETELRNVELMHILNVLLRCTKSVDESLCEYVSLEGSKLISMQRYEDAQTIHSFTPEEYGYIDFFYGIKAANLPACYPFTDFPARIPNPTAPDCKHLSLETKV